MPKTKELVFDCKNVTINAMSHVSVRVTVDEPDTDHVLEDIHEDDLSEWVRKHKTPDDLFLEKQLDSWAKANGYTKE